MITSDISEISGVSWRECCKVVRGSGMRAQESLLLKTFIVRASGCYGRAVLPSFRLSRRAMFARTELSE